MAQLREGSIIKKSTGDEIIATLNDISSGGGGDVPTKTSELENDSGFLTTLPAHDHNGSYYTEMEIDNKLNDKVDNGRVLTDVPTGAEFTDTIYIHPTGTNPHGTTKADVDLSNVTNDKQMPIRCLRRLQRKTRYIKWHIYCYKFIIR